MCMNIVGQPWLLRNLSEAKDTRSQMIKMNTVELTNLLLVEVL